jgi:ribose transport system permease protein
VSEVAETAGFLDRWKGTGFKRFIGPLLRPLGLLALCIVLSFLNENFFTLKNIISVLRQSTILVVVAVGMTVVILTAGIDLSVGGVMALVGCLTSQLIINGTPIVPAIACGLVLGTIFGLLNGVLVRIFGLPPFVATYGMMWIANGLAMILMQGKIIFGLPDNFLWLGSGYLSIIPIPVILAAVVAVAFHFYLKKTVSGREIYALGANREAARYSGIKITKTLLLVYSLSGFTAAIAGIIMTARLDAAQEGMGEPFMLQAIAAVVMGGSSLMGGEGGIPGTIIGALILTLVVNGLNLMGAPSMVHPLVTGAVILTAVFFDVVTRKWSD